MGSFQATEEHIAAFRRDGYVLVPGLFDAEEMDLLLRIGKADAEKAAQIHAVRDAQGGTSKLWLTADTGREDIYNGICHGRRVVEPMAAFLGDEVYLYHYKMMVKEPRVGGAWEWHQDYGYWYHNGCLFPDMASCYIAVDRAHRGNGCLQVIPGRTGWGASSTGRSAARPARTRHGSTWRWSTWGSSTARWNPARPCSSTPTCSTAATPTPATTRAGA
jgi:hypothetical protein